MSQMPQDDFALEFQQPRSNTLGLVGFILSFCLSPIGLILSLIGLGKPPRGFAIAGVVIGLLGTCLWIGGGMVVFWGVRVARETQEVTSGVGAIQTALTQAKGPDGKYPADLTGLSLGAQANDPWGRPYKYERTPDGLGYMLTSAGKDGQPDTGDDIAVSSAATGEWVMALAVVSASGGLFGDLDKVHGAKAFHCASDMVNIEAAIDADVRGGKAPPKKLADIAGLSPALLTDPWGTPYVYTAADDNKTYYLKCNGPDKLAGTQDDVDLNDVHKKMGAARARANGGTP